MQGQWLWRRSVVAGLVLALTACSSSSDGKNAAVRMVPEPAGARCPANADGIQGASEVTSTQYLCNHEDGTSGGAYLVKLLPETSGANCSRGGTA